MLNIRQIMNYEIMNDSKIHNTKFMLSILLGWLNYNTKSEVKLNNLICFQNFKYVANFNHWLPSNCTNKLETFKQLP